MHRIAILTVVLGVAIGIVGGVLGAELWIGVGGAIAAAGIAAIYLLAMRKDPREVLRGQAKAEALASGYPARDIELPPQSSSGPIGQRPLICDATGTISEKKR